MSTPSDGPTFGDLLSLGELGDREIEVRLTVRQIAAVEMVLEVSSAHGVVEAVIANLASSGDRSMATGALIALGKAAARLADGASRAYGAPVERMRWATALADLDQQEAAWRAGE